MSAINDNWERLVAAVLRRDQLWQLFHDHSRSPSNFTETSDFSSCFSVGSPTQRSLPELVLVSDFSPAIDVNNLRLDSFELLGRGTFGSTYTAAIDDGASLVVKRLKSASIPASEFKQRLNIIASIRHDNVVSLRAYYTSKNERLMLYDYYSNGSVFALLHGQADESRAPVYWETRLRVALGAARGIAEIHKYNCGKLSHGNIKSSNVMLNPKHYGCVSDLGLANLIETTQMPNSKCYAPEVKDTQNVSQASDVYSFGILLFELLSRKSIERLPGGPEPVDLVNVVGSVKNRERAAKVFDADLLKNPTIKYDMVKMLQIGVKCVSKSVKERPRMSEVVQMLDDISKTNRERKLVFVGDVIPTFDLEELLRAKAKVLGKGIFGTCYKARLENGKTVVVKRLKDVYLTFKEFQQHVDVMARTAHENIVELHAYYFSKVEKLLIYDYYNQRSPLARISPDFAGNESTPLDWDTRMKIVVGAARGIAHIHRQDDGKLVHGNINSSNILVDEQKYGIISDVGLAKLIGPIRISGMPNPGYCPPEFMDTRQVCQASDVYSFGVVLLQLLTGKPPLHTTNEGQLVTLVEWIKFVIRTEWTSEVFDITLATYLNQEAMMRLLHIAMDCVAIVPERRPRMAEIVKTLEEISGIDPSDKSSLEDVLENAWGQSCITSRLEDLLEDILPQLTP